ncbi:hypothetical protein VPH35_048854 [Triticum aestivum]
MPEAGSFAASSRWPRPAATTGLMVKLSVPNAHNLAFHPRFSAARTSTAGGTRSSSGRPGRTSRTCSACRRPTQCRTSSSRGPASRATAVATATTTSATSTPTRATAATATTSATSPARNIRRADGSKHSSYKC